MANTSTILDLVKKFPDEKSCHQYLAATRWDTGEITCPHENCGHDQYYVFTDGIRYKCKECNRLFTAKTKSFMEGSKLASIKWILAMYLITHKKGISSIQLGKDIGVTQKTAWFLLHRIRNALCHEPDKQNLDGVVEIDETFVGGKNKNRHYCRRVNYKEVTGRTYPDKTTVFGMYERGTGQVRAMVISRRQLKELARVITYNIKPGATLMTDDWIGYRGVDKIYNRRVIDHGKWIYADGEITTNRIENFWSHLKRGLHGTYIRVTPKHLNKYVNEFVYRFNSRTLDSQQQIDGIIKRMVCRLKYKELKAA
ncbi:IS1595 family transposase [Mucilaginibacter terrigena]|uniref:IS1595 family transposase n=1 Tax=Mucilaginibacter terrigena TaxID=2492395 RepID=A0A4Q5LS94_9SPHI|nr:IS1595 family transposase [Mucilaginibacter terrigena]RYU92239.1 IS1595 family transposase [Mucilaginibacter terrigena]